MPSSFSLPDFMLQQSRLAQGVGVQPTRRQMRFLRSVVIGLGGPAAFHREFAGRLHLLWTTDEHRVFGDAPLQQQPAQPTAADATLRQYAADGTAPAAPAATPQPMPAQPGRYVAGVDVAEGLANGDATAIVVLDTQANAVVAVHSAREPVDATVQRIRQLQKLYPGMHWGIERNNYGAALLTRLADDADFPQVHTGGRPGIATTATTKVQMILAAKAELDAGLRLHDEQLIAECRAYAYLHGSAMGGAGGMHDDTVMALAMAIRAAADVSRVGAAPPEFFLV